MSIDFDELGARDDAPSLVLLHGVGTSGWMWQRLARSLAPEFHVLVPDLPGHGRSSRRQWRSLASTVADVADLIRTRASGGRAHVVGLSLGGYVAAQLSADLPDLVPSAVLSGVNVLPFPRPRLMRAAGRAMAPFMTSRPMLAANAKALRVPDEDLDDYREAARSMARGTFLRVGEELMGFRVPALAPTSSTRVLATAGENEQPLILQSLPELASGFRHGTARIAPGFGHAWSGEAPELFADTVRAHAADGPLPTRLIAVPRDDRAPRR